MRLRSDRLQAYRKEQRKAKGALPEARHNYQKGDFVLWRSDAILRPHGSLTAWYLGPYEVTHQQANSVHAVHCSSGKEAILHHDRLVLCTTNKQLAIELARQDFPEEHLLLMLHTHKGDLTDVSSLTFLAIFADGDRRWLTYAEVRNTEVLASYARRFQCTQLLLRNDIAELRARWAQEDILILLRNGSSFEGHCLPRDGEVMWVSLFAFGRSSFLNDIVLPDDKEYVLQSTVTKITKRRIELTFTHLQGLKVGWSLLHFLAFANPIINGSQSHLDAQLIASYPGLAQALGSHSGSEPAEVAPRTVAQVPQPDADVGLEARLNDGTWHPIIVQERRGRNLDAHVPNLHIDITVPLTRVRKGQNIRN